MAVTAEVQGAEVGGVAIRVIGAGGVGVPVGVLVGAREVVDVPGDVLAGVRVVLTGVRVVVAGGAVVVVVVGVGAGVGVGVGAVVGTGPGAESVGATPRA